MTPATPSDMTGGEDPPSGAAAGEPSIWVFGPEGSAIVVRNADLLLAHLPVFLGGWPCRWEPSLAAANAPGGPDIDILRDGDGRIVVTLRGPGGGDMAFDNAFDAANGLAGALISGFIRHDPTLICLHAGSALIGGALAVVVGESFAGKSSIALQLTSSGCRLFGDDRLAVRLPAPERAPEGLCLGLNPKVRLPLPVDAGARFGELVDAYKEIESADAAYLKLWSGEAAEFGDRAEVSSIVLLSRLDAGPTTLEPASPSEIVSAIITSAHAPHLSAEALVAAATRIGGGADGYRLEFSSSREAAARLISELSSRPRGGAG